MSQSVSDHLNRLAALQNWPVTVVTDEVSADGDSFVTYDDDE